MTGSLFSENRDFFDSCHWNSTCNSKYGVSSTQFPSSISVVVKNFKIAYTDILKYRHVAKDKFFVEWDDIL